MIKGYLELFDYLCEKFSTMGNEVGVVSIPKIAKDTNTNASDITKQMHILRELGLVVSVYRGGTDWLGYPVTQNGWTLTDKAVQSETFQAIEEAIYKDV